MERLGEQFEGEREKERIVSVGERGRKGGSTMLADCEATMAVNMVGQRLSAGERKGSPADPQTGTHTHTHTNTTISPLYTHTHTEKPLMQISCGTVVWGNWMQLHAQPSQTQDQALHCSVVNWAANHGRQLMGMATTQLWLKGQR